MKRVINRKRLASEDAVRGKSGEKLLRTSNRCNTGKMLDNNNNNNNNNYYYYYYYYYQHYYYQQQEKKCETEPFCCSGFEDSVSPAIWTRVTGKSVLEVSGQISVNVDS